MKLLKHSLQLGAILLLLVSVPVSSILAQCPGSQCALCDVSASISNVNNATVGSGSSTVVGTVQAGGLGLGTPLELTATGCGAISMNVTVSFDWDQGNNINWIHGISFTNSPGWTVAQGNNPGAGWLFENSIVGCCSGAAYGAGYYYDGTGSTSNCCGGSTPGNPADNYGINCSGGGCPSFTFSLEFCPNSTGDIVEAITFSITDDGETGDWGSPAGCIFNITVPVIFNAAGTSLPPNGVIGPVCEGDPVTLNAGVGCNSYNWSDGQTGPVIVVTPMTTDTWCVTASSGSGCQTISCVDVLTMACCASSAGTPVVNPPNPCPGSMISVDAVGYTMGATYQQTVFLADDAGNIIDVFFADSGVFTLPDGCNTYTAYSYNFDFTSGAGFPLTGTNVSTLNCNTPACCDLVGVPVVAMDAIPPLFTNPPANMNFDCPTNVPPMTDIEWADNCDGSGFVSGIEVDNTGGCTGGNITRTWEYTDLCGNLTQHIQLIAIDPVPPAMYINPPASMTLNCGDPVPPAIDLQYNNGIGGACAEAGVVPPIVDDQSDACTGGVITYTWSIIDNCGNLLDYTQTITLTPATPAMFVNPPPSQALQCGQTLPPLTDLQFTNNLSGGCSDMGFVPGIMDDQSDACNGGTITYTWAGADNCGNPLNYVQTFTIQPSQPPMFVNPPAPNMVIQCGELLPPLVDLQYDNNLAGSCNIAGSVIGSESGAADPCGSTVTYTWADADACGNPLNYTQTITIQPAPPAQFVNPPAPNMVIQCGDPLPDLLDLTFDNGLFGDCANFGTIVGVQAGAEDPCGSVVTYTWSGVDNCGNPLNYTQNITVQPAPPAQFVNLPSDMTIQCGDPFPTLMDLQYDNQIAGSCANSGMIPGVQVGMENPCGGIVTYTWNGVDNCGIPLIHTQVITVLPAPDAILINPPFDASIVCGDPMPPLDPISFDNGLFGDCANFGVITGVQNGVANPCGSIVQYVWNGVDNCGMPLTHTQVINIDPAPPADFVNPPADVFIQCGDIFPTLAPLQFDNGLVGECQNTGVVPPVQVGVVDPCIGGVIQYIWTGADNCGNQLDYTQNINIDPAPAPMFINPPADMNIPCDQPLPPLLPLQYDNGLFAQCQITGFINGVENGVVDPCVGGVIEYSWIGVDQCGNDLQHTQFISVDPAAAPTLVNQPADITVNCGDPLPPLTDLLYNNNAFGPCQITGFISGVENGFVDPCLGGTIENIWEGTDQCGNFLTYTQFITVLPAPPAIILNLPSDMTINCGDPLPPLIDLQYSNNIASSCLNTGLLVGIEDGFVDDCFGGTISYIWEDVDQCGEFLSHVQNITVLPATPPMFLFVPPDITVDCNTIPPQEDLPFDNGLFGSCNNSGFATGFEIDNMGECPRIIERIWEYTDPCTGMLLEASQNVTVSDFEPPFLDFPPLDVTICSEFDIPFPVDLEWFDNCSAGGFVFANDSDFAANIIVREWVAIDDCGNNTVQQQFITINEPQNVQITGNPEICEGDFSILEVQSDGNIVDYSWTTGDADPVISATVAGTYGVTITNEFGCTAETSFDLSVVDPSSAEITGVTLICSGDETTLTANGGTSYAWSSGQNAASITINVADTYEVTVTDAQGCTATAEATVTEAEGATVSINGNDSICENESTTLTATGNGSFVWSTTEIGSIISTDLGGDYTVTVTSANGCTNTASFTVNASSNPVTTITGTLAICNGDNTTLDAGSGFDTYTWSDGSGNQTLNVTSTGTYGVTVTNAQGCSGTDEVNVITSDNPTVSIGGSTTFCAGSSTTLDAGSGFSSYIWSNSMTSSSIVVNTSGDYSVTVTDANGCSGTSTVTVDESDSLNPVISGIPTFCTGFSTILDAGSGLSSYEWSTGETSQMITVSQGGIVSVTVMDAGGCEGSTQIDIIENENPTPSITGLLSLCNGASTTLDAGSGFSNYEWSNSSVNQTLDVTTAGMYSVTVTDANGCVGTNEVEVVFNTATTPTITGVLEFCSGFDTDLDGGAGYNIYAWSNGEMTQMITATTPGTYILTVTDSGGCTAMDQVIVEENTITTPTITGITGICSGEAASLDAGADYNSYVWSTTENTQTISPTTGGIYTVTVTNIAGCTAVNSIEVEESPNPSPTITGEDNFCTGDVAMLDAGAGFDSYLWSNNNTNQTLNVSQGGIYTVTVTNAGCEGTASFEVTENEIPTPAIAGITEFCEDETSTLDAGAGFNVYDWSTSEATQTIVVESTGMYDVTVTNDAGCSNSTSVSITENIPAAVNIIGSTTFCTGFSTLLGVDNTFATYEWSTGETTASITVNTTSTVSVTVTDINGCESESTLDVSESTELMPEIGGIPSFCEGNSTILDAGAGFDTYSWSNGDMTQTTTISTAGTYGVTVSDESGCNGNQSIQVTQINSLTPIIEGVLTFCPGGNTTLNVTETFATYEWSTSGTENNISVDAPGMYQVTVSDANGCTGETSIEVSENTPPVVSIGDDQTICAGESTLLIPDGTFFSYEWSTGETSSSLSVADANDYGLTVTDAQGCTGSTTMNLATLDIVVPTIAGEIEFCFGDNTILDAGAGYTTYEWSTGEITQMINATNSQVYAVTVTNDLDCSETSSVIITELDEVIPAISGSSTFCSGFSTILDAGSDYDMYEWSTGETSQTIEVNTSDDFSVTVTTVNGCVGVTMLTTQESTSLMPVIVGTTQICAGDMTTLDAGTFDTYEWSTGETTQTIDVSTADDYSVTVSANGCEGNASITIEILEILAPTITGIQEFCFGDDTTLDAGADYASYQWSTGEITQMITVTDSEVYTVTVTNDINCSETSSVTITELDEVLPAISGSSTFCSGFSTNLDAGADYASYQWSTGEITQAIEVNTSDDFSVTVTTVNGCVGTTMLTTQESTSLMPVIVGTTLICAGDMTTLDAGAFDTYEWSTGETTQTIDVSTADTYSVTVSANGCEGETATAITVEAPPVAGLANDTNQCEEDGSTIDLNQLLSGSDNGGIWTETSINASGGLDDVTGVLDPTGLTQGTFSFEYTVEAADVCDDASVALAVTIDPLPTVVINGVTELTCTDNQGDLVSMGSTTGTDVSYAWTTMNGAIVTDASMQNITVGSQGTYTLTIDWNGCTASESFEVTSNDVIPAAITTPAAPLDCEIQSVTLDGSSNIPNAVYSWTGPNGFTSNIANPIVDAEGEYILVVTNPDNACQSSPSSIVLADNSNNPSALIIGSVDPLGFDCVLASIVLDAVNASANGENTTYQWHLNNINSPIIKATAPSFEVFQVGTYILQVIDTISGCTALDSIVLPDLTTYPIVDVLEAQTLDCSTNQTTVESDVLGNNLEYEWTTPNGSIVSGATTDAIEVDQSGWYYLTAVDNQNGCTETDSIFVNANFDLPTADAGTADLIACDENSIFLNGENSSSSTGSNIDYQWSGPAIVSNANTSTPSIGDAGTYALIVTDQSNGCTDESSVEITEPPTPNVGVLTVQGTGCADVIDGSIVAQGANNGTPPYSYSINNGAFTTTPTFEFLASGDYMIAVQDAEGCIADTMVVVPEGGTVEVNLGADIQLTPGETTQLLATTNIPESEIAQIIWTPSIGLSCTDCLDPIATALGETTYEVTILSTSGCEDSDAIFIRVEVEVNVYVPSAFSPNEDGLNDFLTVFSSREIEQVNVMRVYDRWGTQIFEAFDFEPNNPSETTGWDGTYKGKPLDPAVFVWYAEILMPSGRTEIFKGDVTLMR